MATKTLEIRDGVGHYLVGHIDEHDLGKILNLLFDSVSDEITTNEVRDVVGNEIFPREI